MEESLFDGAGCVVRGGLRGDKYAKGGKSGANAGVFAGEFARTVVYKGGKAKGRASG